MAATPLTSRPPRTSASAWRGGGSRWSTVAPKSDSWAPWPTPRSPPAATLPGSLRPISPDASAITGCAWSTSPPCTSESVASRNFPIALPGGFGLHGPARRLRHARRTVRGVNLEPARDTRQADRTAQHRRLLQRVAHVPTPRRRRALRARSRRPRAARASAGPSPSSASRPSVPAGTVPSGG